MAIITCRICGDTENSDHYIPETKTALENKELCFSCLHWSEQHRLDQDERCEHKYAIINGTHYVLLPHTDGYFKGYGGKKFHIRFNDGFETTCDNLWCQGDIPEHWRDTMPDNAIFVHPKED